MSETMTFDADQKNAEVLESEESSPTSPTSAVSSRTIAPRRAVQNMPEYHPPLAGRNALRLDFNENTHAPSPRVREALGRLTLEGLTIYPERAPVEAVVASVLGLRPEQVLLTNAVDEAIHLVCFTYLEEGDECLFATPSFFMYDVNATAMGAAIVRVQADASLQFPHAKLLAAITPRTKLIILASPNNPTGAVMTRAQIHEIATAAPHALVMVDEAYFHFFGETVMDDIATGTGPQNMIVARTFSKAYGLANLRAGLLAGPATLIDPIRKASSPYNVNGVALLAVEAAVGDAEFLDWYVGQIREGRARIEKALDHMKVPRWPSEANFVLMRIGPKHKLLVEAIRARGVLLRDRSADPGLAGFVRMTVGVEDQVSVGIAALRDALASIGWVPADGAVAEKASMPNTEHEGVRDYE